MIKEFRGYFYFLSNFYSVDVFLDGTKYPSVEHAYQAAKTLNRTDRLRILRAKEPGFAKRLGRKVVLRPDWEDIKIDVMYNLLKQKFDKSVTNHFLIATYPKEIEEGNHWHDNFWGNCYCSKCKHVKGQNHLGKLLMKIREEKINEK